MAWEGLFGSCRLAYGPSGRYLPGASQTPADLFVINHIRRPREDLPQQVIHVLPEGLAESVAEVPSDDAGAPLTVDDATESEARPPTRWESDSIRLAVSHRLTRSCVLKLPSLWRGREVPAPPPNAFVWGRSLGAAPSFSHARVVGE